MKRRTWPRGDDRAYRTSRLRLVGINLLVVSALIAAMATAIYGIDAHSIGAQTDQQLHDRAMSALHDVAQVDFTDDDADGDAIGAPHNEPELTHYSPNSPNIFVIVVDGQGDALTNTSTLTPYGLPDQPALNKALQHRSTSLETVQRGANTFRLYTIPVYQQGLLVGAAQLGMSLYPSDQQIQALLWTVLVIGTLILLLTTMASFFLADRALMPLRTAFSRQRQFAAAASHELRTPLAFVRSQLELVERQLERTRAGGPFDPAVAAADVRDTIDEVDFMARLVRDLLTLGREAADQHSLQWAKIDVKALATEVVAVLAPAALAKHITLSTPVTDVSVPIRVQGDRDRLRQLLIILLDNAIRHTPPQGNVSLDIQIVPGAPLRSNQVQMSVIDTGEGIAAKHLPHLFEAFYRADTSRTPGKQPDATHAGLGLALARWIAQAHGGTIHVKSTLGVGSTFTVTLPFMPETHS